MAKPYQDDFEASSIEDIPFIQENRNRTVRSGALMLSNLQSVVLSVDADVDPSDGGDNPRKGNRDPQKLEDRKRKNRERMAARRKKERDMKMPEEAKKAMELELHGDSDSSSTLCFDVPPMPTPIDSTAVKASANRRPLSAEKKAERKRKNRERMARKRKMQRDSELQQFLSTTLPGTNLSDASPGPIFDIGYDTSDTE